MDVRDRNRTKWQDVLSTVAVLNLPTQRAFVPRCAPPQNIAVTTVDWETIQLSEEKEETIATAVFYQDALEKTRVGLAQEVCYLSQTAELCGGNFGVAVIGHKFARMVAIQPNRIAIEYGTKEDSGPTMVTNLRHFFRINRELYDCLPHTFIEVRNGPTALQIIKDDGQDNLNLENKAINQDALQRYLNLFAAAQLSIGHRALSDHLVNGQYTPGGPLHHELYSLATVEFEEEKETAVLVATARVRLKGVAEQLSAGTTPSANPPARKRPRLSSPTPVARAITTDSTSPFLVDLFLRSLLRTLHWLLKGRRHPRATRTRTLRRTRTTPQCPHLIFTRLTARMATMKEAHPEVGVQEPARTTGIKALVVQVEATTAVTRLRSATTVSLHQTVPPP